jgi:hypothetical protein
VFTALTATQASLAIWASSRGDVALRNSQAVGAVVSGLGLLGTVAIPFGPAFSASGWASAGPDPNVKLTWAEERLLHDAKAARFGRSWLPHVAGVVVGVAAGLVLALAFHQITDGIINGVAAIAVNELKIWTQPMQAVRGEEEYGRRFGAGSAVSVQLVPTAGGAALVGAW